MSVEGQAAAQINDGLLIPFLQAAHAAEAQRWLGQLISEHAEPIIKAILSYKLHASLNYSDSARQSQDAEDVHGEVLVQLIGRLRDLKNRPSESTIANFRSYVAVTTYHCCYEYLRQKYPERWRLKNRLRYLLTHQQGLDLWETEDKGWVCGFAGWRNPSTAKPDSGRLQRLLGNPQEFRRDALPNQDARRMKPADLLHAIFEWVDSPIELDRLTTVVAALWDIKDQTPTPGIDEESTNDLQEGLPDLRVNVATEVEQRMYLERLWAEICQLPLRQRTTLLLNLRDAQGRDVIALFPMTGIASIRKIAEALAMPAQEFAKLWNNLPLEDSTIAQNLGVTRQQVINLRKSARERLARRMSALDTEKKLLKGSNILCQFTSYLDE